MEDSFYVCGGWQLFNRACALFAEEHAAELVTYREREPDHRHLDDVPREDLRSGLLWTYWQSHLIELSSRLPPDARAAVYAMNTDYGPELGQRTPIGWPIAALSRYIAADYALKDPGRCILYLGAVLHPEARNVGRSRDIDVLFHRRKCVPYLENELVPRLEDRCKLASISEWLPQQEFLGLLQRCKVYLYWTHEQIPSVGVKEGLGMQPIEAIACGAIPAGGIYAGPSDYMEPPHNCLKLGTHSPEYDAMQILEAVKAHPGSNPGEEKILAQFGEAAFRDRIPRVCQELENYFGHRPSSAKHHFDLGAVRPTLRKSPRIWLYRQVMGRIKRIKGELPR